MMDNLRLFRKKIEWELGEVCGEDEVSMIYPIYVCQSSVLLSIFHSLPSVSLRSVSLSSLDRRSNGLSFAHVHTPRPVYCIVYQNVCNLLIYFAFDCLFLHISHWNDTSGSKKNYMKSI